VNNLHKPWLVILLFALPGCASQTGDAGHDTTGVDGAATATSWMNETVDLSFTQANNGSGSLYIVNGTNCLELVASAPVVVLGGNVTLTWTAQTPLAEDLRVALSTPTHHFVQFSHPGTSPLTYPFAALPSVGDRLWVRVEAGLRATAIVQQPVTLTAAMHFQGEQTPDAHVGACPLD
jgi:hypothetical protein